MMEIERPKIETASLSPDGRYGKFVAEPLERGFGITLGNSLRRVLLSSLPGVAVTSVKIDGVVHEFSTIEGVKEDVTEIVLNLKGIAAKLYTDGPKTVRVEAVGPCEVTADNIKQGDDIEILNPEWHIATLGEGGKLVMELTFDKGRGYVPAERNKQAIIEKNDINTLPVDSIYTPVLKVNYNVESTRVGQAIDYDKLTIEVWTDGTINAQEAGTSGQILAQNHHPCGGGLCGYSHRIFPFHGGRQILWRRICRRLRFRPEPDSGYHHPSDLSSVEHLCKRILKTAVRTGWTDCGVCNRHLPWESGFKPDYVRRNHFLPTSAALYA